VQKNKNGIKVHNFIIKKDIIQDWEAQQLIIVACRIRIQEGSHAKRGVQ
jgi:hypothetical protein